MKKITEKMLQEVLAEVDDYSGTQMNQTKKRMFREQPHLWEFVQAYLDKVDKEAAAFGTLLVFLSLLCFEKASDKKLQRVGRNHLKEVYRKNETLLHLPDTDDRVGKKDPFGRAKNQPQLWKFALSNLYTEERPDWAPELSDNEKTDLLWLVNNVVEMVETAPEPGKGKTG